MMAERCVERKASQAPGLSFDASARPYSRGIRVSGEMALSRIRRFCRKIHLPGEQPQPRLSRVSPRNAPRNRGRFGHPQRPIAARWIRSLRRASSSRSCHLSPVAASLLGAACSSASTSERTMAVWVRTAGSESRVSPNVDVSSSHNERKLADMILPNPTGASRIAGPNGVGAGLVRSSRFPLNERAREMRLIPRQRQVSVVCEATGSICERGGPYWL